MRSAFLLLLLLGCVATATAQNRRPAAADAAFRTRYPNAEEAKWERTGTGYWEVEFEMGETEREAIFDAQGQFVAEETEVSPQVLSPQIVAALNGQAPIEAAELRLADGSMVYEVETRTNGRSREAYYRPDGTAVQLPY